jgi:hypothetical protein
LRFDLDVVGARRWRVKVRFADVHVSLCQAKSTGNPGALRRARVATISGFTARK